MLSKRIKNLKPSGIRKFFNLAFGSGKKFIDLSIGQPHFNAPKEVKEAAKKAVSDNFSKYTPTQGISELREGIAKKLASKNKINARPEDVIITAGTSGGIFLAMSTILDPGDEIIIPDPYFVLYNQVAIFLGAKVVLLDTYPDFKIKPDRLERLITSKTKALIINSPNNPTGAVYSDADIKAIAEIARKNGLIILSDEIYEYFDYENRFFSIGSVYEKTVTFNGFSKSHSLTGWRIGYAHGPSEAIKAMGKLQQYTFICAPAPVQRAALAALKSLPQDQYRDYKGKRDCVYEQLKSNFNLAKPQGAFFAFLEKPQNRDDFAKKAINKGLLIVPGEVFSSRDTHFRLSFAVDDRVLEKGLEILNNI